ncbi:hypothetical protein A2Z23_00815 [Candidatus Curtissbacteria bacterium RBG_16_39_7]|uniref:Uncharacterized protein n=1 Tax=Candidatus Curtissbacteria bacterium RBG_16_39_7 TaxID=1797707 RepID=A0A1F5G1U7_9BACT|nr:MAG: hypothetical protein A2Z23_00815 [Candidatus Curtissbacteria bacterium RBG_16_39_7]
MQPPLEPEEEFEGNLRKRVRAQRRKPKTHQIVHESGRGLKKTAMRIVERSKELKEKREKKEKEE